jgi:NADH-quinone oxidoreductase subunit C
MNSRIEELAARIQTQFAEQLRRVPGLPQELTYEVASADLLNVCRTLRDEPTLGFEMLMDVCGVDYLHYGHDEWKTYESTDSGFSRGVERTSTTQPAGTFDAEKTMADAAQGKPRFAVAYHLLSIANNWRVRLRCYCPDERQPMVDSVTAIWSSANWFEREAFDLYGILFRAHPDLRRILTDYGFIGHPFRKDFPLSGNVEVRYDPVQARVIYEPVQIVPRTLVPKVIRDDNRYEPALKDVNLLDKPRNG